MIGYSLSMCAADIASGLVAEADVEKIVAGTKIETPQQLKDVMDEYDQLYWSGLPKARAIALRLWANRKVVQPRLNGAEAHYIGTTFDGRWKKGQSQ